jgi:hypothetical protein
MDLVAEPGWILQGRGPCGLFRTGLEPDIGRYVDNGRRILGRRGRQLPVACLAQSFYPPRPMPNHMRRTVGSEKDVKIVGTNSISHLESTEVAKNELKTNSKRGRKRAVKTRNEAKQTPILAPEWGPAVQPGNGALPRHRGRVWE